jgi:eight-cysteine-cluster-containing protein
MKQTGFWILFLGIIGVVVYLIAFYVPQSLPQKLDITSFEECVAAGNPVMESYPRQCRAEDGQLFVENLEDPIGVLPSLRTPGAYDECVITGCSGQICADEEVTTTCEYKEEYACYKEAVCERQKNGVCEWTQDVNLNQCLIRIVQ